MRRLSAGRLSGMEGGAFYEGFLIAKGACRFIALGIAPVPTRRFSWDRDAPDTGDRIAGNVVTAVGSMSTAP